MMKDSLWIREASGTKLVIPIKTPTGQQTSRCQRHIHRCLSANDFRSEWSQFGRLRLSPMGTMSWSALPFKAHGRLPKQLQISCSKWSKKVEVRVLPASLRNYLMALKNIILCASVFLIFYLLLLRRIQGRQVLDGQAIFWINLRSDMLDSWHEHRCIVKTDSLRPTLQNHTKFRNPCKITSPSLSLSFFHLRIVQLKAIKR